MPNKLSCSTCDGEGWVHLPVAPQDAFSAEWGVPKMVDYSHPCPDCDGTGITAECKP